MTTWLDVSDVALWLSLLAFLPRIVQGMKRDSTKTDLGRAALSVLLSVWLVVLLTKLFLGDAVSRPSSLSGTDFASSSVLDAHFPRNRRSSSLYSHDGGGMITGLGRTFSNALTYILLSIKALPNSRTSPSTCRDCILDC